ncbi:MAG: hypothetical protein ACD_79C00604G0002 [uncultured bacterium]|nr:MAG: hypothetical protein ACD_79C00604G0002 [uncultured bacterium]
MNNILKLKIILSDTGLSEVDRSLLLNLFSNFDQADLMDLVELLESNNNLVYFISDIYKKKKIAFANQDKNLLQKIFQQELEKLLELSQ